MTTVSALGWPFVARRGYVEQIAAALVDPGIDLVHICGVAGVGKTRLATQALAWAESDGFPVAVVRASRSAATVPLSAMAPLLPSGLESATPARVFAESAASMRALGDGSRVVVHVDDVDELDTVSLALLASLLTEHLVVLLTTQREEAPTPDVVSGALRSGRGLRFEVEPLSRESVGTLLHLALEGPTTARLEETLWSLSKGNPLFLRELVLSGLRAGTIARQPDVWSLEGALTAGGGLADIVSRRLNALSAAGLAVIEALAVCGSTGAADLEVTAGPEEVEALEASGLIEVAVEGRRHGAVLAHPMYAHVVRESVPTLRRRRLLLAAVDRVQAHGARRKDDALRLAMWRLDATGTADVGLLLEAAQRARYTHDYVAVERLARAAILLEPNATASALCGEALYELGRFDEADAVLARATWWAQPWELPSIAVRRSLMLYLGLGRLEDALRCLVEAEGVVPAESRSELMSVRALLLTQGGRSRDAADVLESTSSEGPGSTAQVYARARAWVLLRTGRPLDAAVLAMSAHSPTARPDEEPELLHPAGARMVAALGLLEGGELTQAEILAEEGAREAAAQAVDFQAAWLHWVVGQVLLGRGDLPRARQRFSSVAAAARVAGFTSVVRVALASQAEALAQTGAAADARAVLDQARAVAGAAELYSSYVTRATGWVLVAEGSNAAAVQLWTSAAQRLLDAGELVAAADLLHAAIRVGDRGAAAGLMDLSARIAGTMSQARALQARGVLDRDLEATVAAAEAFAGLEVRLVAAEVFSVAAGLASGHGDPRRSARLRGGAAELLEVCPGAATPGLRSATPAGALTRREQEVALLAASGKSSKDIATALVLSVRTVDNHLQSAYAKLGVTRREQLAEVLGQTAGKAVDQEEQG